MPRREIANFAGCLLGGAIGDALGAPVEFNTLAEIRRLYGPQGVTGYTELNEEGCAEFTDDTQMTLFTAEGLLVTRLRGSWTPTEAIYRAYLRWLRTQRTRQTGPTGDLTREGWLLGFTEMWKIRAPGNTCINSLASGRKGTPESPPNDSKGCGGVMRVAPIGLTFTEDSAFDEGCAAAALTHGHPSGYLPGGVLAQVIAEMVEGKDLEEAIQASLVTLSRRPRHEETLHAVQRALTAARECPPTAETVESLGSGWVGEEALAISLFCALAHPDNFAAGVLLAVNHSGDSDSTGAITGNLLGLLLGREAIPTGWVDAIELRAEIERMAELFIS
jgi:ADP-ribosyl-[dinitrogen reductase] hydrolase